MKYLSLAILFISLSACSMFKRHSDKPPADATAKMEDTAPEVPLDISKAPPVDETKPLTDNIASPIAETAPEAETVDVTLNKKSYLDEKYHAPQAEASEDEGSEKSETLPAVKTAGVHPDKALKWLKNGNKRFLKGALRADGQSKKDVKKLSHSEKPHSIIFASSDSRLPPEIIFDEKLGEIFVIRNFGLTVDKSVLNSIDYAVGDLGVRLLVVMDKTLPGKGAVFGHADETIQQLVDQSAVLKAALESRNLDIVPAVYNIDNGRVVFGK